MRILLGQTNPTPRAFSDNTAQIINGMHVAKDCDLAVFPELSICGYLVKDLVYNPTFIDQNLERLQAVVQESLKFPKLTTVVGLVTRNTTGVGKPFRNTAAVVRGGAVIATYHKHLIPFYDVFDEGRYFEPGTELAVVWVAGARVGISICEDIWNDKEQIEYLYNDNPIASYRKMGVDMVVNLSSSPYCEGKPLLRHKMLQRVSMGKLRIVYVNQHGGQDDLVFDGHSGYYHGDTWDMIQSVTDPYPIYRVVDTDRPSNDDQLSTFNDDHINMLKLGLRDYVRKSGHKRVVLGSSGGVDSAFVATLACNALGPENVTCIMMPSSISSVGSVEHAKALHKNLGCAEVFMPLFDHNAMLRQLQATMNPGMVTYNSVADQNLQARLRGMIVMYWANAFGALALTTGNKTELATGYCTLYGDMNGGFNPIADLYKGEIRYLIRRYYPTLVPPIIVTKPPSAELAPDQEDEKELVIYPVLDQIVRGYVEEFIDDYDRFRDWVRSFRATEGDWWYSDLTTILDWFRNDTDQPAVYNKIIRRIDINEFKRRQAAIGQKVKKIAFGTGRRLPVIKA